LRDLLDIETGDVIILNRPADDTVILCVDGRDKYEAELGLNRYRKTVKINKVLKTEHDLVKDTLSKLEENRRQKIQAFRGEA